MIDSVREELQKAIQENQGLKKHHDELETELSNTDLRLKSILKEKELLFSRLMTVERDIDKLK